MIPGTSGLSKSIILCLFSPGMKKEIGVIFFTLSHGVLKFCTLEFAAAECVPVAALVE